MLPIGILLRFRPQAPTRPLSASAFGRAALALADEGVPVRLVGTLEDQVVHFEAKGDAWIQADPTPLLGCYHRYPELGHPEAFAHLMEELSHPPLFNPQEFVERCRDKQASHQTCLGAGLAVPEQVAEVTRFEGVLSTWGVAFLKPRFGAFGEGVLKVRPGDPLPTKGDWVLQKAIQPPEGLAGMSVRLLVQRDPERDWVTLPAAVRQSTTDPVVNRARGAEVVPASTLTEATLRSMHEQALQLMAFLTDRPRSDQLVELGLDFVIDHEGGAWLIEMNGKPKGRLEVLAAQQPAVFAAAHTEAVLRPLRYIANRLS